MANTDKYNSINDIPSPPIEGGYMVTFRTTINRINKIVQTFIDKFKVTDTEIIQSRNDFASEIQGKHGTTVTFPPKDVITRGINGVQGDTIVINTDRKYNYGFFLLLDNTGKKLYSEPILWNNLSKNIYMIKENASANDNLIIKRLSIPTGGYVFLTANSTDDKIEITPQFTASYSSSSATVTIPANSLKIQYELH